MELISKSLFWIANSLLIPDILLLLLLFARSIMLIGSCYAQFLTKRKTDALLGTAIKELSAERIDTLKELVPSNVNSLFIIYLSELLGSNQSESYCDFLLSEFENKAEKDLNLSRTLSKIGPILGLIGTLIAMSPALVGLSSGDIAGMAYNMQIVFATTVVGLLISAIGLVVQQIKQRWYASELNKLEYVSQILQSNGERK